MGNDSLRDPVQLMHGADAMRPGVLTYTDLVLVNQPACPWFWCDVIFCITMGNTSDTSVTASVSSRVDTYKSTGGPPVVHDVWDLPFQTVPAGPYYE